MHKIVAASFVVCAIALVAVATPPQDPKKPAAKKMSVSSVFGTTKVHKFHLEIAAAEWQKMQPAKGGFGKGGGFGAPKKAPEQAPDKNADVHKGAGFGLEFPWAHADFTANDKLHKDVGIRFRGNFTYIASANGLRRPMQIDLDRYDGKPWKGLKKLVLGNGITDPARMRESIGFAIFRNAGVPAPRTAYAEVTLTIPGKYDKEFVGLYTLIEHVGSTFLKDRFKNDTGLLLKPEGLRGLDYLGEEWPPYVQKYRPKGEATKKDQDRLIAFTRLVNRGDDEQFRKEIGSFLDIDGFLRYLAVNAFIASLDSPLGFGHNFFMYLRPDTNQFVFMPWDLDLSMGTWPVGGPTERQMELSLQHPHIGQHKLIDRVLAVKEINDKYQTTLKELAATVFTKEKLLADIDALEKVIKEPLEREKKAVAARQEKTGGFGLGPPGGGMFGHGQDLREFVVKRTESVAAQLAGKSKGYVPAGMGFGPGGGGPGGFGMRPLQPGEILPAPLQQALKLTDEQKRKVAELQKETDAKLKGILTDDQNKQLQNLRQRGIGGPGFGPPGGPGFGPPGGFNPPGPPAPPKKS